MAGGAALAAFLVAIPAASMADQSSLDGDGVDPSNSKNSQVVLCPGDGGSVNVFDTLTYQGNTHFAKNSQVTITPQVPTTAADFLTASGATLNTGNWDKNSDPLESAAMPIDVGANWIAGQYRVDYTITGTDTQGHKYVLTDSNNVTIAAKTAGCGGGTGGGGEDNPPPVDRVPTVNVTGLPDGGVVEIGTAVTLGCAVDDDDPGAAATPQVAGPDGDLSAYGLGTVTVTCSYTDDAGQNGTDRATYTIVDTTAPVISDNGPTAGPDGAHGWYVTQVTNQFKATDAGAGFPTDAPKLLNTAWTTSSGPAEGAAVTVGSGTVDDVAGNTATAIDSQPFNIDLSDPELNVSGAPSGAYDLCSAGVPTRPTFRPYDAVSGLDGSQHDELSTPSTATGVGTYTYTATATDIAGRSSTANRTYQSVYGGAFSGVTQPINGGATVTTDDDTSIFKLGSTVPIKFTLTCSGTPIAGAVAKLVVRQADQTPDPDTAEAISTAASTTGNLFRYDATAGQYIFNLSTKTGYLNPGAASATAFTPGTYTLSVLLDDGTSHSVNVQLRK